MKKAKTEEKLRFLYVFHLPPPWHGAAMISKTQWEMEFPDMEVEKTLVPVRMTEKMEKLASFSWKKIFRSLVLFGRIARLPRDFELAFFSMTVTGWSLMRDVLILFLLRRKARRIMLILHDIIPAGPFWLRKLLKKLMAGLWVGLLSPLLYKGNETIIPAGRVVFLPNGYSVSVDDKRVEKWIADRMARKDEPLHLLYMAHMSGMKGLFVFLEALEIIKNAGCTFQVSFLGVFLDNTERRQFDKIVADLDPGGGITWHGFLSGREKEEQLCQADIFVFPTLRESFGGALVEAMGAGLPVVASREGSIPWIVAEQETALLFPLGDAGALANALLILAADPERRAAMGKSGRERFLARFTREEQHKSFVAAVKTVLSWRASG